MGHNNFPFPKAIERNLQLVDEWLTPFRAQNPRKGRNSCCISVSVGGRPPLGAMFTSAERFKQNPSETTKGVTRNSYENVNNTSLIIIQTHCFFPFILNAITLRMYALDLKRSIVSKNTQIA